MVNIMSRVGKQPIKIPREVTVEVKDGEVTVTGPKGSLSLKIRPEVKVDIRENQIFVSCQSDETYAHSLHGLTRTLIANAVTGVTQGFSKTLKIIGTGYRASLEEGNLVLLVGFSHPIKIQPPPGIKFEMEGNDKIKVLGADKALVGQIAAQIRRTHPPDPYKGKGIRYEDEEMKLKPGKAGKAGTAGGAAVGGGK
jgi:large subunit ribosomal protein L6